MSQLCTPLQLADHRWPLESSGRNLGGEQRFVTMIFDGRGYLRCKVRPLLNKDHENVCHLDSNR